MKPLGGAYLLWLAWVGVRLSLARSSAT